MVRRHSSYGRRDEGEDRHRVARGGGIAGSRPDKRLAETALHAKSKIKLTPTFLDGPGRRKATGGHSISRFLRRLAPFPFPGRPVVAGDTALDHFVAPPIACHDERGETAAAKTENAKGYHDDELQKLTHTLSPIN